MSKLLINLGSGQRPFSKPWVNVDCQSRWEPDIVANGSSMPMFEDGSGGMIVLHHVLEHFGCGEGMEMLRECHRILAPGGSLIVTVPDMVALVKGWVTGRIDDQIFLTNIYGAYMGDEADRHKWGFTYERLFNEIESVSSWRCVKPFNFRDVEGADIARDWWILGMEAVK